MFIERSACEEICFLFKNSLEASVPPSELDIYAGFDWGQTELMFIQKWQAEQGGDEGDCALGPVRGYDYGSARRGLCRASDLFDAAAMSKIVYTTSISHCNCIAIVLQICCEFGKEGAVLAKHVDQK